MAYTCSGFYTQVLKFESEEVNMSKVKSTSLTKAFAAGPLS